MSMTNKCTNNRVTNMPGEDIQQIHKILSDMQAAQREEHIIILGALENIEGRQIRYAGGANRVAGNIENDMKHIGEVMHAIHEKQEEHENIIKHMDNIVDHATQGILTKASREIKSVGQYIRDMPDLPIKLLPVDNPDDVSVGFYAGVYVVGLIYMFMGAPGIL